LSTFASMSRRETGCSERSSMAGSTTFLSIEQARTLV
jgi:hypothetical protein